MLTARVRYLGDRTDASARDAVHSALQPATRAILARPIDANGWYPFEAFVDMNVVMDRVLGIGDLELCYEIGRHSAQVSAPALYRAVLSQGDVPFVLRRAAGMWTDHYDSGTLDVVESDATSATLRILGFATPHRAHCRSVTGWITRVVELVGGKMESHAERVCQSHGGPWCEIAIKYR